jgi:hypothetical protein
MKHYQLFHKYSLLQTWKPCIAKIKAASKIQINHLDILLRNYLKIFQYFLSIKIILIKTSPIMLNDFIKLRLLK